jgi:hypothetical protein
MRLPAILFTALALSTAFSAESGHDRYIREQFEQMDKEISTARSAADPLKKLAEIQRRMNQIQMAQFDLTKGESNVCPVHHIKMPAKEVPIAYGPLLSNDPFPAPETRARMFPFGRASIIGGCMPGAYTPKTGKVFLCPKCYETEKAWIKAHRKSSTR